MKPAPTSGVPPAVREKKKFFTEHALDRAKERYHLDLSAKDMWDILEACLDGRAQMMRKRENGQRGDVYVWTFHGIRIYVTVQRDPDRIITFNPPKHFAPGALLDNHKELRPKRDRRRMRRVVIFSKGKKLYVNKRGGDNG